MINDKRSQDEHGQVMDQVLKNPLFTLYCNQNRNIECLPLITSSMIEEAKARLEAAAGEKLSHLMDRVDAISIKEIYNQITDSPSKRSIIDVHQGMSEEVPEAQSFCFGKLLKKECEATQQDVINNSIKNFKINPKIRKDFYKDMYADLCRAHQNQAKYSLIEEDKIIELNHTVGIENLNIFKQFVGVQQTYLQIAIASIMHQGVQADFEKMKLGAPRDHQDENSSPFFTKGLHTSLWSPRLEGPIFSKLFSNEGREEIQLYDLRKITTHQSPLFEFTATCRQSVKNSDFTYHLCRYVRYHIEINRAFQENLPITEENICVKIRCLDGKIVQLFD